MCDETLHGTGETTLVNKPSLPTDLTALQRPVNLTIVVPAFNEEAFLAPTLDAIEAAAAHLRAQACADVETIVSDNNSKDQTADVARAHGAAVVHEPVQNIARACDAGTRHSRGTVLVFVDADVTMPLTLLNGIHEAMNDPACVGGAVEVEYRPRRLSIRLYLRAWRLLGCLTGMAQGAAQFCRKCVFDEVGGYDEEVWIGEDVDFYWELRKHAKTTRRTIHFIREPHMLPSSRRFDKWPIWKTLVWTNPLFIALFRRWRSAWKGWYSDAVR